MVTEVELVTTQAKLSRLIETKNAIRQKLISLGVNVPINTLFSNYPDLIEKVVDREVIETTSEQDLLQILDLYKYLGTARYEDRTYTDEEIQSVYDLLNLVNNGEVTSDEVPEVPEPYLMVLAYGKTDYYVNDMFDLNGYVFKVIYGDGTTVDVTDSCAVTLNRPLTLEDTFVTVSCELDGVTFTLNVDVSVVVFPYIELSYIQSSGTQYIDTGIVASSDTNIEIDFEYISGGTQGYMPVAVQRYTNGKNMFGIWINTTRHTVAIVYGTTDTADISGTNGSGRHVYKNLQNQFYIDDALVYTFSNSAFTAPGSLPIFAIKSSNSSYDTRNIVGRLYSCKMWKNGSLVRHLIPVKRVADNVICMYDKITETYIESKGSNSFIGGEM